MRTDSLFIRHDYATKPGGCWWRTIQCSAPCACPLTHWLTGTEFTFELLAHGEQPARTETLTITYDQEAVQFAEHCRLQTRFFNLDTLSARTTFDSVRIENRELAEDVSLNLRIVDFIP